MCHLLGHFTLYLTTPPCPLPKQRETTAHLHSYGRAGGSASQCSVPRALLFILPQSSCLFKAQASSLSSWKCQGPTFFKASAEVVLLPGMLSISHPKGTPKYQCTALPDSTAYDQTASVCFKGEGIISNPVSKTYNHCRWNTKTMLWKRISRRNWRSPVSIYIPHRKAAAKILVQFIYSWHLLMYLSYM